MSRRYWFWGDSCIDLHGPDKVEKQQVTYCSFLCFSQFCSFFLLLFSFLSLFLFFTFFVFLWASLENHHKRLIWDIGWFSVRAQLRVVSIPWVPIPGPNLTRPADHAAKYTYTFSSFLILNWNKYDQILLHCHVNSSMYLHSELLTFNSSRCFVLFRIILSVEIPHIPHCVNSF